MDHAEYAKQIKEVITLLEMNHNNKAVMVDPSVHRAYDLRNVNSRRMFFSSVEGHQFVEWVKKEADVGNSYAEDYLGELYYCGIISGVAKTQVEEKDYVKARDLFKRSADKGNSWGQFDLGYFYSHCLCSSMRNNPLGHKYLMKSAINGHSLAKSYCSLHRTPTEWEKLVEEHETKMRYEKLEKENQQLKKEIEQLKEQVDTLKTEIEYRPGGPGYHKAKEDAESLFDIMSQLEGKN